jgi:DNA-binding transcriptional LysR family regulator
MQFTQLNCFLMVAKLGSVTKAAELMYVTQSAVTKNIAALEKELGVLLFDRKGKRVSVSAAGRRILPNARTILSECDRIKSICGALGAEKQRVTFTAAVISQHTTELVSSFKKLRPDIELIQQRPWTRGTDIIIELTLDDDFSGDRTFLLREEIVLVVPSNHPLAGRFILDLAELAQYPIISFDKSAALRQAEDHYCALAGFTPRREREVATHTDMGGVIDNEEGVVFAVALPGSLDSIAGNRIVRIGAPDCHMYIYAELTPGDVASREAVKAFFDHIVAFFSRF